MLVGAGPAGGAGVGSERGRASFSCPETRGSRLKNY